MSKEKCADMSGVVAEMLQKGTENLFELMAVLFTDVMKGTRESPKDWKQSFFVVLHKKGDTKMPGNYRPIALLPVLYKVFSRVLGSRVEDILDDAQPVVAVVRADEAWFNRPPRFATTAHDYSA